MKNTMDDILKRKLLRLERALSALEGYEGWMIGTTTLHLDWQLVQEENNRRDSDSQYAPKILRKGRSAIRVRIEAENKAEMEQEWMEVLLVKPRQDIPAFEKKEKMQPVQLEAEQNDDAMVFDRSQMEEYLKEAADTNPIHQGKEAVLPGFLVMNECLRRLQKISWIKETDVLEVRFLAPLYLEECVYLSCPEQEGRRTAHLKAKLGEREILSIAQK